MIIAVVGAGAAGCFAAINVKRMLPEARVIVYEGGTKALAKVAVTGGGRCNLTNTFADVEHLGQVYPRGERLMKRLLKEFGPEDVVRWFEKEGVRLMTQDDQRVFPQSGDAGEIVRTLLQLMCRSGIELKLGHRVKSISKSDGTFHLSFVSETLPAVEADKVIVAVGGCPQAERLAFLKDFQLDIIPPVSSLFSLCIREKNLTQLTGTTVEEAIVSLAGTKFKSQGALLITHWGMSGPAVLKLSSYAARQLAECNYKIALSVNWMGCTREETVHETVIHLATVNRLKQLQSVYPSSLNSRLWLYLLSKASLNPQMRWADLGKKGRNRLVVLLTNDVYQVEGKNRFKEEFVTCGGIALNNVNSQTLECRTCEGLYFAGEMLDVDAITGGFNLQAAWTMGYIVAKAIKMKP